ncbi:DoxX family protein [Mycobacterium sp. URHB0044]|uniref:DoxX family protein n=1 Tax=Mycobacterium sp. URHB0044 TaxID=1380386 RepID=UPI00048C9BD5|nr:DoxX family protein [Mycobacterium sp. URHB0044]
MFIAYLVATIATILANAAVAIADFLHAESTLKTSAEVGVPRKWLRPLGVLKAAGAGGLLLGLLGVPWIGVAAAIGLTLFFIGAVGFHIRARVFHNVAAPAGFLALAVATLVLTGAH